MIKSGGMASVFEAEDVKLANSPCAVKEIHDAALASRDLQYIQQRFYEEMKAMVALDHPAIPKVRDYVQQESTLYLVMELVKGRSLDDEIAQRKEKGEPVSVSQVVADMILLLDTLDYLHAQDPPIIHRDIKPANILRDLRNNSIKLVDFGLARALEGQSTQSVVGTHGYSSPEQLMGQSEQRSDVYSVGVTLAQLLTGEPPAMELFAARRPELGPDAAGLGDIIARATEPEIDARYASAREMANALKAWQARPSVAPAPVPEAAAPALVVAPPPVKGPSNPQFQPLPATSGWSFGSGLALVAVTFAVFLLLGIAAGRASSGGSQEPAPVSTPAP